MGGALRRIGNGLLILLAALELAFEELFWNTVAAAVARLARLRLVARIESRLARLPPYPAMTLFLIPVAMVLPFKLYGTYLIALGHILTGLAVILTAKLAGTVFLTRLFVVCRPQLMRIPWFTRLYTWFIGFKSRIITRLHALPAWIAMARAVAVLRGRIAGLRQRLRALLGQGGGGLWQARLRAARRVVLRR